MPRQAAIKAAGNYHESSGSESDGSNINDPPARVVPARKRSAKSVVARGTGKSKASATVMPQTKKRRLSSSHSIKGIDLDVNMKDASHVVNVDDLPESPLTPPTPSRGSRRGRMTVLANSPTVSPEPEPVIPLNPRGLQRPRLDTRGRGVGQHSGMLADLLAVSDSSSSTAQNGVDHNQLGRFVWVRLDKVGTPVPAAQKSQHDEGIWWPAQRDDESFSLSLYGTPPSSSLYENCSTFLLERFTSVFQEPRYDTSNFAQPLSGFRAGDSSHQACTPFLLQQWQAAVSALVKDGQNTGGLPDIIHSPLVGTTPPPTDVTPQSSPLTEPPSSPDKPRPRKRGSVRVKAAGTKSGRGRPTSESAPARHDPGPDVLLTIPGEPVLARWRGQEYWPARIEGYHEHGKYHLLFCDEVRGIVPRSRFVYEMDEDFTTVPVGQLERQDILEAEARRQERAESSTSPGFITTKRTYDPSADDSIQSGEEAEAELMLDDPPPPPGAFAQLPMRTQLAYTLPVLRAIVTGVYPAQDCLHRRFFGTGRDRHTVAQEKHLRGELLEAEKYEMERELWKWLFGPRRPVIQLRPPEEVAADEDGGITDLAIFLPAQDAAPAQPSRGQGGFGATLPLDSDYARLSGVERITYYHTVLVPEATLQLLLWRGGHRTSRETQGEDEESKLRAKGKELSEEKDFTIQVLQLRAAKLARAGGSSAGVVRGSATKGTPKALTGGTRSRPR